MAPARPDAPVLAVRDLSVEVATATGGRRVLDSLDFTLGRGETLCLAGESGSGKSMTALALMGLLPKPMARRVSGQIVLDGTDLAQLSERRLRSVRAAGISMIFQEPMTSLNPIMRIGDQLGEVLAAHGAVRRARSPGPHRRAARGRAPDLPPPTGCASTRTSCPAACASGS